MSSRSWELLQLIFVGIAVSYGLFSKRNDDQTSKENSPRFDNAQAYVSRLLQVSSVFDDEVENQSFSDHNHVQTWNSQYHRVEPMVVVAQESSALEEKESTFQIDEKPLLLPIRSLKSKVADSVADVSSVGTASLSRSASDSGPKKFSSNSRRSKNGRSDSLGLEESTKELVLRSPIPWRSRSGKADVKEHDNDPPVHSLATKVEDSELDQRKSLSYRSLSPRSSRNNSTSPTKLSLSLSPSSQKNRNLPLISSESQAKNIEGLVRKTSFRKSSFPPPPPPPPPPFLYKSSMVKSNSSMSTQMTTRAGEPIVGAMKAAKETEFQEEKNHEFIEKAVVETDEDTESEDDYFDGSSGNVEAAPEPMTDEGPDVDKKADEFIAKFREQIRLQRIASIRRSAEKLARN